MQRTPKPARAAPKTPAWSAATRKPLHGAVMCNFGYCSMTLYSHMLSLCGACLHVQAQPRAARLASLSRSSSSSRAHRCCGPARYIPCQAPSSSLLRALQFPSRVLLLTATHGLFLPAPWCILPWTLHAAHMTSFSMHAQDNPGMTNPADTTADLHKQQASAGGSAGQANQAAAQPAAARKPADAEATPAPGSHVRFCTPGPEHAIVPPRGSPIGLRTAGVNSSNAGARDAWLGPLPAACASACPAIAQNCHACSRIRTQLVAGSRIHKYAMAASSP